MFLLRYFYFTASVRIPDFKRICQTRNKWLGQARFRLETPIIVYNVMFYL